MRRGALIAAVVLAGCGEEATRGPDYSLRTPKQRVGAEALTAPYPRPNRKVTAGEAEQLRPVLSGWTEALTAGDDQRAARYFTVPTIWAQGDPVELRSAEQVLAYNRSLPCGAKVLEVQQDGRYVVATLRLRQRPGGRCSDVGELLRVAFVVRSGKFTELRQIPDTRGAPPGPSSYEPAPAAPAPSGG
jgi:hypothetical protein